MVQEYQVYYPCGIIYSCLPVDGRSEPNMWTMERGPMQAILEAGKSKKLVWQKMGRYQQWGGIYDCQLTILCSTVSLTPRDIGFKLRYSRVQAQRFPLSPWASALSDWTAGPCRERWSQVNCNHVHHSLHTWAQNCVCTLTIPCDTLSHPNEHV